MGEMFNQMMDEWIPEIARTYTDRLGSDGRFPDAQALLTSFNESVELWTKRRTDDDVKALTEKANELAAALSILGAMEEGQTLAYEPKLTNSKKSIDFLIKNANGIYLWVDVKTVAPKWVENDAEWKRFSDIKAELPKNMHVVVEKELGGAGIGGQMLKTRWTLYSRAAEIEAKLEELTDEEKKAPLSVLFCSSGFAWHVDTLEDFADFYRNGTFRQDDWASTMVARYMDQQKITFKRTLAGFHYLERGQFEALPKAFRIFVRGPSFLT